MSNFTPGGSAVLTDGVVQPISVDVDLRQTTSGAVEYWLFLMTKHQYYHPFRVTLLNQEGRSEFHATVTWFAKSRGRMQVATLGLYKREPVEGDDNNVFISLDAMQNRYVVVCNKSEFPPSLFFKRMIKYCVDRP